MSLCTCEHIDCRCIGWDRTHHNACPVLAGSLSLAPLQDFFFFFFFFFFFLFCFCFEVVNLTCQELCDPLSYHDFLFKGASLRIYLSSLSHQFCCFTVGLGPVTVRVPLVVNLQKALCLLGFMYCISFILFFFHRSCRYIFEGETVGMSGCQSMVKPLPLISQSEEQGFQIAQ